MTTDMPYATGSTWDRIERALLAAGHPPGGSLSPSDLDFLEEFHLLGRLATDSLVRLAEVTAGDRVLDAGSGVGGTARHLAGQVGCQVATVDLTPEYCDTARRLNARTGLGDLIDVREGDVLDLPFPDGAFDVVVSQHVQMNIADKARLYAEASRVLAPGGRLALWDVVAGPVRPLRFPVMWAERPELSHLVTPEVLRQILRAAGFEVRAWNDLTADSAAFTRALLAEPLPPLGLQVYVPDFERKLETYLGNLEQDRARLLQAVLVKTG
ncbi:methyltransferase domain-containing protein [Streptomyces sp. NBC_00669]|uniref:SAM-dependent methyltransferase n=1 Tax=unclassified Streptomyces TaxID=2593676 RepID=UPI002E36475D|nr:class I SAM-dependent methyltransferase [Streptomyces sp. NBC_00669]